MNKITIRLEVDKIDKNLITTRTYQTKDGETKTVKEYKLDCVELEKPKFVTQGTTKNGTAWQMFKTHFLSEPKKDKDAPTKYIGNGFQFQYEETQPMKELTAKMSKAEDDFFGDEEPQEIKSEDIPF